MKYQEPPVYRASYELAIAVLRFSADLPEKYQTNFALLLETKVIEILDVLYRINTQDDKAKAIEIALARTYFLRTSFSLFLDLRVMKVETNVALNNLLEEVLKQLLGWRKSLK